MDSAVLTLSDDQLLKATEALNASSCALTAQLLVHLAEVDRRRLFAPMGLSSMFGYCTERLGMAEGAAFKRIRAARAGRKYPLVIDLVAAGRLNLTGINLLSGHLTEANHVELLHTACGKSKRQIEVLVADLHPKPDVPDSVRKLPEPRSAEGAGPRPRDPAPASPSRAAPNLPLSGGRPKPPDVEPLGGRRYKVQFMADEALHTKLRRAQDLMSHRVPDGDLAALIDEALDLLCDKVEKERFGARRVGGKVAAVEFERAATEREQAEHTEQTAEPRPEHKADEPEDAAIGGSSPQSEGAPPEDEDAPQRSRYVPAAVRRAVYDRDGGQCTYVSATGHRCQERRFLELHHEQAWALGGGHTESNLTLRCWAHNQLAAREDFGEDFVRAMTRKAPPNQPSPRP